MTEPTTLPDDTIRLAFPFESGHLKVLEFDPRTYAKWPIGSADSCIEKVLDWWHKGHCTLAEARDAMDLIETRVREWRKRNG